MGENSRIAKNTVLLYIRMLAVMAVSLYTSRIVLQNLGITDYGLYSLVGGVATMFIFLNSSMSSVTQRFLSVEISNGDIDRLNKVFNVSVTIHAIIGLIVVLLCEFIGLWFISCKMQIPIGRESAVFWIFQISMVSTYISMIMVPFTALIISRERMGAFAYISIFDVSFKLFAAYLISVVSFDKLITYSLFMAVSQGIVLASYFIYCKCHFNECAFKFYKYEPLYKNMLSFASWELLGHFSSTITSSVQDMMLNTFFSPIVNAARGIAITVSNTVNNFRTNFTLAVEPQITISYAAGKIDRTLSLVFNSSRIAVYLLFFLTLPLFLCIDEVLHLWLVEVPQYTSHFIKLILINNLILSSATALNTVIRANGKIKYPSIFGGLALIMNLPLSLLLFAMGCSPYSCFIVMIGCSIVAQSIRIYYAHRYIYMPLQPYLMQVIIRPSIVMIVASVFPAVVATFTVFNNSLSKLLIVGVLSVVSVFLSCYFLGASKKERIFLKDYIKNKLLSR